MTNTLKYPNFDKEGNLCFRFIRRPNNTTFQDMSKRGLRFILVDIIEDIKDQYPKPLKLTICLSRPLRIGSLIWRRSPAFGKRRASPFMSWWHWSVSMLPIPLHNAHSWSDSVLCPLFNFHHQRKRQIMFISVCVAIYGFNLISMMLNEVRVHRASDNDRDLRLNFRTKSWR